MRISSQNNHIQILSSYNNKFWKRAVKLLLIFMISMVSYYAYAEDDYEYKYNFGGACNEIYDPYENWNRKVFIFNTAFDKLLLQPLAIGYNKVTNNYTKARIDNFYNNITLPLTIVNYAAQMKFNKVIESFWQFLINTTIGIGGMFDVASKFGLSIKSQTIASTLAYYGASPGPYLVIPFFGGITGRGAFDTLLINNGLNFIVTIPQNTNLFIIAVDAISQRATILAFSSVLEARSTDYYIAYRNAIIQNNEASVVYPANFKCPSHTSKLLKR